MKIGILETGELPPELAGRHGDYPAMFEALLGRADAGLEFATVSVVKGEMPTHPGQADAWLVTGSRHGVYDDLPWIEPLKAFLRDCIGQGVPVVGICFGHQILAEALGGEVVKSDRGWGLGVQEYELTARPSWMPDMPDTFAVRASHQDQVVRLPEGATVLARSSHCPFAAVAYGDLEQPLAITLQPHPEFNADFLDDLIALRAGKAYSHETVAAAAPTLRRPDHNDAWARLIVDFVRRAATGRATA